MASKGPNGTSCGFCATYKAALSPYTVNGEYDDDGDLPKRTLNAVHRLVTDRGAIARASA
ncbi:MAG: hypothetical protein AAGG11_10805 [Pseudomonadota bacterium]